MACCSMLEEMMLAKRVLPLTMPIPVSSQDVSIPKTTGSVLGGTSDSVFMTKASTPSGW